MKTTTFTGFRGESITITESMETIKEFSTEDLKVLLPLLEAALKDWQSVLENSFADYDKLRDFATMKNIQDGICQYIHEINKGANLVFLRYLNSNPLESQRCISGCYYSEHDNLKLALETVFIRVKWLYKHIGTIKAELLCRQYIH